MSVSVIMATYNNERDIGLAVASVLLQDYEEFELVIVNDASTDATAEIIERFAAQDDRIVLVHNERNLGRALSRNRAIETARGDLIAILDADDVAMPFRLSHQVAFMQAHQDVGMLGGWALRIDEHNQPLDLLMGRTQGADLRRELMRRLRMPFCHSTVMFRREVLLSVGMYDPRFIRSQDVHLCRRVIQHVEAASLPEWLALFRLDTSLRPEVIRIRSRWATYARWDSLREAPNLMGFVNLIRPLLLSCLPLPAVTALSGIYRRKQLPSEAQKAEVLGWIRQLEEQRAQIGVTHPTSDELARR
jgi:glycosyltransferase involved in cell wall biosynthesis